MTNEKKPRLTAERRIMPSMDRLHPWEHYAEAEAAIYCLWDRPRKALLNARLLPQDFSIITQNGKKIIFLAEKI